MIFNQIVSIAKKGGKEIAIINDRKRDGQWLKINYNGNTAYYYIGAISKLTTESIKTFIQDSESWDFYENWADYEGLNFDDNDKQETEINITLNIKIGYDGDEYWIFETEKGKLFFVNTMLLKPIRDEFRNSLCYFKERKTDQGSSYIAVKTGMFLTGIFYLNDIESRETFTEQIRKVSRYLSNKNSRDIKEILEEMEQEELEESKL
jgi:hypothetical protein